ncbi:MAG: hypothetical protein KF889_25405 [Alphaproteobacteria bacterium]|nr:hypothetical protein [Alphaproteobacteria bacterium]MCW5739669.1 hypothetical protein [Alphaproteobacteria bacterium]
MTRAALLLLALTACGPDRGGMAGCFEPMPDGRMVYRAGWEPMSTGLCPTPAEAVAIQSVRPAEPCGATCRLRAWRERME